jgi:hypothetical protein
MDPQMSLSISAIAECIPDKALFFLSVLPTKGAMYETSTVQILFSTICMPTCRTLRTQLSGLVPAIHVSRGHGRNPSNLAALAPYKAVHAD